MERKGRERVDEGEEGRGGKMEDGRPRVGFGCGWDGIWDCQAVKIYSYVI